MVKPTIEKGCVPLVVMYSKTWLQRLRWIATTCFQRLLFVAWNVSFMNFTANSDHLPCVTSDRVFHAQSTGFPCVAQPCGGSYPSFHRTFPDQSLVTSQNVLREKKPASVFWRFEHFLWQILYSKKFSSAKNFVKSDCPAVRQEFIFVKRRSSLVALQSFGHRSVAYRLSSHSWIFLIPHL